MLHCHCSLLSVLFWLEFRMTKLICCVLPFLDSPLSQKGIESPGTQCLEYAWVSGPGEYQGSASFLQAYHSSNIYGLTSALFVSRTGKSHAVWIPHFPSAISCQQHATKICRNQQGELNKIITKMTENVLTLGKNKRKNTSTDKLVFFHQTTAQ